MRANYVDPAATEPGKLSGAAIDGMLASLGDGAHTRWLSAADVRAQSDGLAGKFEGVGAQLALRNGAPRVIAVQRDAPASAAGLQVGDVVVAVDDRPVDGLGLTQVVEAIRGPAGTAVELSVRRGDSAEETRLTLERAHVEAPTVTWAMLPGTHVMHVALSEFGDNASAELRRVMSDGVAAGAESMVLDLRGNPGGLRDAAVDVAGLLLASATPVLAQQDSSGQRIEFATSGAAEFDLPIAVLVDHDTASAAEILAGALQDSGRARVIGLRTAGAGTVLTPFMLDDGSAMLLATERWLTPHGRSIWHTGVTPEVTIETGGDALTPEEEALLAPGSVELHRDAQLNAALNSIGAKM